MSLFTAPVAPEPVNTTMSSSFPRMARRTLEYASSTNPVIISLA